MSQPILLQDEFSGIYRDRSRDQLPRGKVWDLVDYIPNELGSPIRKRGGWDYEGSTLNSIDASAGYPQRVGIHISAGANELRKLYLSYADGGPNTFTITFQGQTTGTITLNAAGDDATAINTALEALSNIAPGDVIVTWIGTGINYVTESQSQVPALSVVTIEFAGAYAGQDVAGLFTIGGSIGSAAVYLRETLREGGGGGTQVVAVDDRENPEFFDVTNSVDEGTLYSAVSPGPMGPMVTYRNTLLIPSPALASAPTGPRKYSAGTLAALGGSPPGTRFFAIYKDRVVAASADSDTPNRIFFSGAGNAESWDTTNRYIDASFPPVALAALRNSLLVYHEGSVERIRGSIPPGSAAANMELEPLFNNIGIWGPDALAVADDFAYWADEHGVYRSDGSSALTDLTKQGGISNYFREQTAQTEHMALAVWRGFVWISLLGGADTFVDFLMFDIERRSWFRFENIKAYNFAHRSDRTDELYFSNRDTSAKQVGKLSSIFDPANNSQDADSAEIEPVIETPVYQLETLAGKRLRNVYLSYDLQDTASQNPNFSLDYVLDPRSEAYTTFDSLTETTERDRRRVALNRSANAVGFRIRQTNRSLETIIYAIEIDAHAREGSRR